MDEVKKVVSGKEVRVGTICKVCKSRLSASSNGGTSHLRRHIKSCKRKSLASSSSQSHLHFDSDDQTTTRDLEALFFVKQSDVKELLNTASCVCLTSDI
jgi:hypothetical protein